MLAATVEAPADLDVEILTASSILKAFFGQSLANSAGETARRGDPSLQVSVPGQVTISTMVPAPGSPSRWRSARKVGQIAWLTQRITKFCSTVVRTVSLVKRRTISASGRSWFAVISPSGNVTVTVT